jgi:phosphotransferase system enzyme I (PtsI)
VAIGRVLKLDSRNRVVVKLSIAPEHVADEIVRFERAVQAAREQIGALKGRLEAMVGAEHSYILDAHMLMLEDRSLLSEIVALIRGSRVNAEWAVREVTERLRLAYEALEDPYFRERGSDIESIVERILLSLAGDRGDSWTFLEDDLIVVGRDFDPSSFVQVGPERIKGLALEGGGRTSHTAIIARSLRVPAVMELREGILQAIGAGDCVLVDGDAGEVVVDPRPDRLEGARARISAAVAEEADTAGPAVPLFTADRVRIALKANLELPHEARAARQFGAEGIGLFRSEFLFFAHPHGIPNVDEQAAIYRLLAEEIAPYPVAIRTLDADPQRVLGRADGGGPAGSVMGLRGIRFSLRSPEARRLLRTQLEAILEASRHGALEIVLPMVSTVDEILEVRRILEALPERRGPSGLPARAPLGIMVETPAAVLSLDVLARAADFLCIGTNDLIQFTLAVDRENPEVADLYQPLHPSILHSLTHVARVAEAQGKPVRICGEVSSNPLFAILLLGMGFNQLSMNAYSIPGIRRIVSSVTLDTARALVERALGLETARAVAEYLVDAVSRELDIDLSAAVGEIGDAVDRADSRSPA